MHRVDACIVVDQVELALVPLLCTGLGLLGHTRWTPAVRLRSCPSWRQLLLRKASKRLALLFVFILHVPEVVLQTRSTQVSPKCCFLQDRFNLSCSCMLQMDVSALSISKQCLQRSENEQATQDCQEDLCERCCFMLRSMVAPAGATTR